jgi:chemotaxis protein histidine kinase CheA
VAGITGASILGDGRVSLILDIAALIQMATDRAAVATLSGKPT